MTIRIRDRASGNPVAPSRAIAGGGPSTIDMHGVDP